MPQAVDNLVVEFSTFLKRKGQQVGSFSLAVKTVELLRNIITSSKWNSAKELMNIIRDAGRKLQSGRPGESTVGNMIRRVLRLVREAYSQCEANQDNEEAVAESTPTRQVPGLHTLLVEDIGDHSTPFSSLKSVVLDNINDLLEELEGSAHNIASQALEHIHSDEVIMTYGHSRTVETFLKGAAKRRQFHVIIAESAPNFKGHQLALELSKANIQTTVITDSAIFAIMSRVNKVIIGTNSIMADGGLMASSGCHGLCMAANHHSVPVLVCSAMFKLCPRYVCSYDQDTFNSLAVPSQVQRYGSDQVVDSVDFIVPNYDFVPPDLVTLLITNIGGNSPSYVYRLLSEYYHEDDFEL